MRPAPKLAALLIAGVAAAARADEPRPIQDNSFLVEEAYNQEPGVIQHISLFQRDRDTGDWSYTFTEEWPAHGQTHQASVTVQVLGIDAGAGRETGFGDVALNYRWQAVGSGDADVAVAPRLSLLLPTGDWERGLGTGGVGAHVNLPVSAVFGRRLVGHFNLGGTWTPSQRTEAGRGTATGVNLAQGLVWLAHPNVNVMLEAAYAVGEHALDTGTRTTETFLLSPGLRGALNLPGVQVVGGLALPFGFGPSGGTRAVLAYLSFEHLVTKHPW